MDTKERFRSIEFTTDNGGVKPIIRNHIKKTAFVDLGVDSLPRTVDNRPYKQIAIDFKTKDPIYAIYDVTITSTLPTPKKSKGSKVASDSKLPDLF